MPEAPASATGADDELASRVVATLSARGLTLATGESLTAGLVAATIADVPGSSAVLRGGVVAYDREVKSDLLAVPVEVLDSGLVTGTVAEAMARGAATALRADLGIGTTGVAGPEPHGGEPVGSVWIAVVGGPAAGERTKVQHLDLSGDRSGIRRQTVRACLALVLDVLDIAPA